MTVMYIVHSTPTNWLTLFKVRGRDVAMKSGSVVEVEQTLTCVVNLGWSAVGTLLGSLKLCVVTSKLQSVVVSCSHHGYCECVSLLPGCRDLHSPVTVCSLNFLRYQSSFRYGLMFWIIRCSALEFRRSEECVYNTEEGVHACVNKHWLPFAAVGVLWAVSLLTYLMCSYLIYSNKARVEENYLALENSWFINSVFLHSFLIHLHSLIKLFIHNITSTRHCINFDMVSVSFRYLLLPYPLTLAYSHSQF